MKIIKYFFEFIIVISLFCVFKILGIKNASNVGSIIGKFFGPFFRSKVLVKKNIKIALGDIDEEKQKKIIMGMWSNIGRTFAEYIFLKDFRLNKVKSGHIKIIGTAYLEQIKKFGRPVIFYSGHFANFELMAMELDKAGIKTAAIYRPLNNFFLNPLMEYLRMKYICPAQIPKGRIGMREIIGKIRDGYSVALMMDQRVSEGKRLPFFQKYNPIWINNEDSIQDFNIIRKFDKILITASTFGWWAAFLSDASEIYSYAPWKPSKISSNKNLGKADYPNWNQWGHI